MIWTYDLICSLTDAPFPCTKEELMDYAERSGAPLVVLENIQELEDDGEVYNDLRDLWEDMPYTDYEFGHHRDEE